MNRSIFRRAIASVLAVGVSLASHGAFASAFQLWEQDVASMANGHAGYAAEANNASTGFFNPAGLTRIHNQQLVVGGINVFSDFQFKGIITVNTVGNSAPIDVASQGGGYSFVPALHYAAPLDENVTFGLSVGVPFGLKTDYGYSTPLKFISTKTSIMVFDVSPSLGVKVTDHLSVGLGPDVQFARGEFDQVGVIGMTPYQLTADGINKADDTAYGYHGGVMYELSPRTRFGLSYHSHVVHHLTGTSELSGTITDRLGISPRSDRAKLNLELPAYTALSGYHALNARVAVMGSVIYTQWNTIKNLTLQNVAGLKGAEPTTNITSVVPLHFRNTVNVATGLNVKATKSLTLKTGIGYDQTPVRNAYRNVQMPDNNRLDISAGAHYQLTESVGLDASWMHVFINKAKVNPPAQHVGDEVTTTDGHVTGGADIVGLQVVWDIT